MPPTANAPQAFFYLVLYCVAFIAPLIIVFLSSYFGTTSQQLGLFVHRHTAATKLLSGVVFVSLALWMTGTLAPLFGAGAPWSQILPGAVVAITALGVVVLRVRDQRYRRDPISHSCSDS